MNFYKILGNLNNYFRIAKFKRKFNIEKLIYLLSYLFSQQSCFALPLQLTLLYCFFATDK